MWDCSISVVKSLLESIKTSLVRLRDKLENILYCVIIDKMLHVVVISNTPCSMIRVQSSVSSLL